ncbi:hypothetical protein [Cellulomonas hominis]|uniref:hypothetical protein n=1 Tax=Cellulomonas hominis TaxID=156981 RepID=UPI001B9211A2|nr:hypothetical protein [Cellulomonas hominis]VTR76660.1 hypothetical protein CHMI_01422 [Cellulomonas hominis]
MATMGFGRLVGENSQTVRYEFGPNPESIEGILVIPLDDPDQWYVDGSDRKPVLARNVLHKALRLQRRDGAWPRNASFFS